VSEIRPSRMSFVGLWEAKIQRSVMEGEAVGVIILVDVINTGPFLPPLTSWGSPARGLKGWLSADDSLRGADFHLVTRVPLRGSACIEPQRLFVSLGLSNWHQIRYFCLAWPLTSCAVRRESSGSKARRAAGAPLGCGRRRGGPRSTEQEKGEKSIW
jgi:hypothetical protein